MGLYGCPACNRKISVNAIACPACGEPNDPVRTKSRIRFGRAMFFVIVLVGIMYLLENPP